MCFDLFVVECNATAACITCNDSYVVPCNLTMKRNHPRTVSPTPTAFSGISNYRNTDSHRRDTRGVPPVPNFDYRSVSKEHYNELGKYLANYLEKGVPVLLDMPRCP